MTQTITMPASLKTMDRPKRFNVFFKDYKNNILAQYLVTDAFVSEENKQEFPGSSIGDQVFLMSDESTKDKPIAWSLVKIMINTANKYPLDMWVEMVDIDTGEVSKG